MKQTLLSKFAVIAVMAIAFAAVSSAQTSGAVGSKPGHHGRRPLVAELAKLNLSPRQKTQIEGMLKQRNADNKAFRKANQGNLPALKAHRKQEGRAFMTSLKSVLTQPQWQQFQADMKTKGHRNAKTGAGGATPPVVG